MARLLVIHHSPTRSVQTLTAAVGRGTRAGGIEGVEVDSRPALDWAQGMANADTILAADGYVLITPANFGYMSGALKHVFDSTFLTIGGALDATGRPLAGGLGTRGRPYGVVVHGRYDTVGAIRSIHGIVSGLGWRLATGTLGVLGDVDEDHVEAAEELGGTLAALLM